MPGAPRVLSPAGQLGRSLAIHANMSALRVAKRCTMYCKTCTKKAEQRSNAAERHIRDFCQRHKIIVADAPVAFNEVSARAGIEERGDGEEPFITRARLHDLLG